MEPTQSREALLFPGEAHHPATDEERLAELGYKEEFQRAFAPLEVFGVAFSVVGLMPSIASVLVYAIPNGGPSAMVWGWAICSLFILFVGAAMAELASAAPTSGGLYYWTHSLSSPGWRNLLCWIVGYCNTIGTIAAVASIDWGCAVQIMAAISIGTDATFSATPGQTFGVYVLVVFSHAIICSLGTHLLARLQSSYVLLNIILCVAVVVALPLATPSHLKNPPSFAFGAFTNYNGWPDSFAFVLSWLAPAWTICSFDCAVHISEEAANAAIAVPWAIVGAISISGVLGWGIQVVIAFCMGNDLEDILDDPAGQPLATIFYNSFGKQGTLALWSALVLTQYMMGSSVLLGSSRQLFAFSRDGALPLSHWLYRINSWTKTPVNTVWFSATIAVILCLLVFVGRDAVEAVFSLSVVSLYIAYSIPIAARFLGSNNFKPGPFSLGKWGLPIAIFALAYMQIMIIVFCFPGTPHVDVSNMNYTVVVLFGILILSVLWYLFPKYGAHTWFKGPVSNVEPVSEEIEEEVYLSRSPTIETIPVFKSNPDHTLTM